MKKFLTLGFALAFCCNVFAASTLYVINAAVNYTLYFNTIAMGICYPQFREYNTSGTSGYCDLAAGQTISFNNYSGLQGYYPTITMTTKTSAGGSWGGTSVGAADAQMAIPPLGIDWAVIMYKLESTYDIEGTSLGASDYSSCHGLPDSWGTYGIDNTYSYFTIGGTRYFVAGEY